MDATPYPISRWYLRPAAGLLARALSATRISPHALTLCGLGAAACAGGVLLAAPQWAPLAAVLVLAAWFMDRADGQLARLQRSASPLGAWLDANVDELVDLGLHVCVAAAAARQVGAAWPWWLLIAFLAGKYLLMYGLSVEEHLARCSAEPGASRSAPAWPARLYHLPGNADVRVHVLAVALLTGCLAAELALVAGYYNFRWIVRYALVAKRWGGAR